MPTSRYEVGTVEWGKAVAPIAEQQPGFEEAAEWFDGLIRIQNGRAAVTFKIYRARILDVVAKSPFGATFTISANAQAWKTLTSSENQNLFIAMATKGQFTVEGNIFEYYRVIKAVIALFDAARTLSLEGVTNT